MKRERKDISKFQKNFTDILLKIPNCGKKKD